MTGRLKYSHSLPITSDIIEYSQSSIEANLLYSKYLNLCYQVVSTKERIGEQLKTNLENMDLVASTLIRTHLLIESNLYSLLSTSSIGTPRGDDLSPHFKTFLSKGKVKSLPSPDYIDITSLGYNKTWGTEYGSLMYSLHMIEEYQSYLSVSEIEDRCSSYYLSLTGDKNIDSTKQDILSTKYRGEELYDDYLYIKSIQLITDHPDLLLSYEILNFLSTWIGKLITWYIDGAGSEDSNTSILKPFLVDIAKACLSHSIDESNSKDLAYLFIHQVISSNWYELIPLLISYRNVIPSWDDSYEGTLVKELYEGIPAYSNRSLLDIGSNILIDNLPPGGFNTYLLLISTALLHRAYLLTHISNALVIKEDRELIGSLLIEQQLLVKRVSKLMYMAGYCLKKTSLTHLRILGGNLILITKQSLPNRTTSKDLLV